MAASYPSAAKSFTTKADGVGNTIYASHVNDIQDEVAAVETALLGTLQHDVKVAATKYLFANGRAVGEGVWTAVTFAAGNFTASTGDWTLTSGDVTSYTYTIIGNTMTIVLDVATTTVSATPSELRFAIPGGATAAANAVGQLQYDDNGGGWKNDGHCVAVSGQGYVACYAANLAAWSAATNTTKIRATVTFPLTVV